MSHRRGIALLAVLFIIMAITVLALGFMARSSTELACGENMTRRMETDQLAVSGLEQARGLILQPQEVATEYWTGATGVQLPGSSNSYDVTVTPSSTDRCLYTVTCDAYRSQGAEKLDRSALRGELRLDPAIALWTGRDTNLPSGLVVAGDMYCAGNLIAQGTINGDVFAGGTISANPLGQKKSSVTQKPVEWPFGADPTTQISEFTSHYDWQPLASATLSSDLGAPGTPCVFYRSGDLVITSGVTINGMLIVGGNLTVQSNTVHLIASKNLPALYVTGDLTIRAVDDLQVKGLAVVDGRVRVSGGATRVSVSGALFAKNSVTAALQLDGVDDYVKSATTLALPANYTLTFWINADAVQNSSATILARYTGTVTQLVLYFSGGTLMASAGMATSTGIPLSNVTGGWHQVSISVTSGWGMKTYLDGTSKVSTSLWGGGAGTSYTYIGANGIVAATSFYKGFLDDIRVYGRILTDAEVATLAAGGAVSSTSLLAQWDFDQSGSGVQVTTEADPVKAAIVVWPSGVRTNWSPAAGAFFKQVSRVSL
jgi:cytoskeletal protein CcmA (bactofilin family)